MNIGVLGGTFDPIHNGHLIIAEEARKWLNLSGVIFVPAGQPWLKMDSLISAAEHRVNMVKLAIADKPYFELSTMEIERPGPSYTVDTLAELRGRLVEEDELFLILGWDNLAELPQWQEPSTLITQCHVVAVSRPDFPRPNLKKLEADIPGISKRVMIMDKFMLEVSSSEIRDRVARGLSIHHLVPEAVNRYIKHYGLYIRD
jgi:nicotinate-nucleotide adenylyltransferase